jgi:putative ABC transport system permease protein
VHHPVIRWGHALKKVVAGFRDIGVFKAIGFTPRQVCGVFLAMMAIPALAGTILGLPLGTLLATPLLDKAFRQFGTSAGVSPLADVIAGIGLPLVVLLAALVPALRASRMPATAAITAGSAPRAGRGLRVQRRLAGSRLPRSVSLGLGLPFARPGRSALTMTAVLLGATTVTFANGLVRSMSAFSTASDRTSAVSIELGRHVLPPPGAADLTVAEHSGPETLALLRATPGLDAVAASAQVQTGVVGGSTADAEFYDGDSAKMGYVVPHGHWLDGPGQIVVSTRYLNRSGTKLGDTVTIELGGNRAAATVVGETVTGGDHSLYADWGTLAKLDPNREADYFEMHVASGTSPQTVAARLQAADPGFAVAVRSVSNPNTILVVFATTFTILLSAVAALGVFNTVLLATRERRRDLGMLKSIGMTPRQVTVMVVTSMALLGLVGGAIGLPLGFAVHSVVMPLMANGSQVGDLSFMMHVYDAPLLAWMFLAGVGIAVLGALVPARSAARMTISEVLHNE